VTVSPFFRQDQVHYIPSRNPLADQPATVSQTRRLSNTGVKADYAFVNHNNNFKAGTEIQHMFLNEQFALGITEPGFVASNGSPGLARYDLTAGGSLFNFAGHTDIKEYAFYIQDNLTFGGLNIQAGLRGRHVPRYRGGKLSRTALRSVSPFQTDPVRAADFVFEMFDLAIGDDNLFHTDRPRYRVQFTAVNLTNRVALYNFLSTFSGTHFVSPRAYTVEIGLVW
jgi:hypothetical protein